MDVNDKDSAEAGTLGSRLKPTYDALWNELAWVHMKWNEFVQLYGIKESRVALLNKAAGGFFRVVQDTLFADVLLHICRLTDPPRSVGRDNLTIQRLPELLDNAELRQMIASRISDAIDKTAFCRDWRNRHLAHKDLALALETGTEPLMPASRQAVAEALVSITAVLNEVSGKLLGSTTMFDIGAAEHGAASLLCVLDDGVRLEAERRERLRSGTVRPLDYAARDL